MNNHQSKKTILLVEDEIPLQNALADKFISEGFEILRAEDGEKGLNMANDNHPDLILLDIVMPKMDGLTMMNKLRNGSRWGQNVPIILLTNSSPDEDSQKIIPIIGESPDYLVKSNWSLNTVVEKVRNKLNKL